MTYFIKNFIVDYNKYTLFNCLFFKINNCYFFQDLYYYICNRFTYVKPVINIIHLFTYF